MPETGRRFRTMGFFIPIHTFFIPLASFGDQVAFSGASLTSARVSGPSGWYRAESRWGAKAMSNTYVKVRNPATRLAVRFFIPFSYLFFAYPLFHTFFIPVLDNDAFHTLLKIHRLMEASIVFFYILFCCSQH